MSIRRRSTLIVLAGAALGASFTGPGAAQAQVCDPSTPGACVGAVPDTVRDICVLREGKYCVTTLGDVLDRVLPPLD